MVSKQVIKRRLQQITRCIHKIERFTELSLKEYENNEDSQDIVEYNLFIAINMMVDIAMHIVVDLKLGAPATMTEAFHILHKNGFFTEEETALYSKMTGLRNLISHGYLNIKNEIIFNIIKNHLKDLKQFILTVELKVLT